MSTFHAETSRSIPDRRGSQLVGCPHGLTVAASSAPRSDPKPLVPIAEHLPEKEPRRRFTEETLERVARLQSRYLKAGECRETMGSVAEGFLPVAADT
jgi:hypothetical protein